MHLLAARARPTAHRWLVFALVLGVCTLSARAQSEPKTPSWTQWGGPGHDFIAPAKGLARAWPEAGPRTVWARDLGEGYSGILFEAGRLYTMYRRDKQEVVIALDAGTGETIWEFAYDAAPRDGHAHRFGDGPRSTPLISGNRIYTIGVSGVMHCLKKRSGESIWSQELWGKKFGGNVLNHGYSSSPIAYGDKVIVLVGGPGKSVVALNQKDGSVAWGKLSFKNSYSTPRLFDVDGEQQLVTFMATEIIGVDPDDGTLRWSYAHENQYRQNVNVPVMPDSTHLFLSSLEAGARGLELKRNGEKTEVSELWTSPQTQFYHVSSVRDGDYVYGSSGGMSPAFITAINIRTGEVAWRKRGFSKANVVLADGRLLILDEDGNLALATATPEDLVVHSRVELLDKVAWTSPTVVGTMLFVRDKQKIIALDLS